jgi:hypothetical protein
MTSEELDNWEALVVAGERKAAKLLKEAALELPYQPGGDNVLVLRLPPPPVKTSWDDAGLIMKPENAREEEEPKSEGYLIAAGPSAMDAFMDAGYLPGDKVQIGRFAGWEKAFRDLDTKNKKKILQMKSGDILGSFDLLERLDGPEATMEVRLDRSDETHVIRVLT